MIIVKCPTCGGTSKALSASEGGKGLCPHCKKTIEIRPTTEVAPPAETTGIAEIGLPPAAERAVRKQRQAIADTKVSTVISAVVAFGLTYLFYTFLLPVLPKGVITLVAERGEVPYVEVYFGFWLASILGIKTIKSLRQCFWMRRYEESLDPDKPEALPEAARAITSLENERGLERRSIFVGRILMAIRQFRVVRDVGQVRDAMTSRSAIDANALDASYVIPQVLIWAIPILGFLGTVWGISIAISQFSEMLPNLGESAKEAAAIRDALGKVTTGLAIAFDTTLLALLEILPLMILMTWLRKTEDGFLQNLDNFCNEDLTKWLHKHGAAVLPEAVPAPPGRGP